MKRKITKRRNKTQGRQVMQMKNTNQPTNQLMPTLSLNSGLLASFPYLYVLSMTSHGMEYPFGQLVSAVPAVSPPNFFVHAQPTHWRSGVRSSKGQSISTAQQ